MLIQYNENAKAPRRFITPEGFFPSLLHRRNRFAPDDFLFAGDPPVGVLPAAKCRRLRSLAGVANCY
jgi:hypothetical protein